MLVLSTAFLLLVCAPALLLVLGRAISRLTDFEARSKLPASAPAQETGEAWYFRRMRPAFRWLDDSAEQLSASKSE